MNLISIDFDGVFNNPKFIENQRNGLLSQLFLNPLTDRDIHLILTGRCLNESIYVWDRVKEIMDDELMLVPNIPVYFKPMYTWESPPWTDESHIDSGEHKKATIYNFLHLGYNITHFDDSLMQIHIIKEINMKKFPNQYLSLFHVQEDGSTEYV